MALLDKMFSRKVTTQSTESNEDGRGYADSIQSNLPSAGGHAADRRNLRLERRELLYAVVRESMARVGVLSSSYKYKVLSLDPRGRQYLIMMDLPPALATETRLLAEIEAVITQHAKARHDIVVKALYWRIDGPLASAAPDKSKAFQGGAASQVKNSQSAGGQAGSSGPIQEEVAAFKRGLAGGGSGETASSAKPIPAWRRNPTLQADFADTQLQPTSGTVESVDKIPPLSGTQYGDLN